MSTADSDLLSLLNGVIPVLINGVEQCLSDGLEKRQARAAVIQRSSNRGYDDDAFHSRMAVYLRSINYKTDTIQNLGETARAAVESLFKVWEQTLGQESNHFGKEFPVIRSINRMQKLQPVHLSRLRSPPSSIRDLLEIFSEECFTSLGAADEGISTSVPYDTRSAIPEWELAQTFCAGMEQLHKLWLRATYDCKCKDSGTHEALFSFPLRCNGAVRAGVHYRPNIREELWTAAEICLKCRNRLPHPSIGETTPGSSIDHLQTHLESGHQRVQKVCQTFSGHETKFEFLVCNDKLLTIAEPSSPHEPVRMVPLGQPTQHAVQDRLPLEEGIGEADRFIPGVMLAYAYLHLSGSQWWPNNMVEPEVWFRQNHEPGATYLHYYQPFVAFPAPNFAKIHIYKLLNKRRPSLPAFGRLLLEIWIGEPLVLGSPEWTRAEEQCSETALGESYIEVVNLCITRESPLNASLSKKGTQRLDDDMKEIFLVEVVKVLEYVALAANKATNMEKLIAIAHERHEMIPVDLSWIRQFDPANHHESVSDELIDEDLAQDSQNVLRLRSDSVLGRTNPIVKLATDWFQFLQDLTLKDLFPPRKPDKFVKIAILDTGANLGKTLSSPEVFGRVKEYRSWCCKSGANGTSMVKEGNRIADEGADKDGHGTHILHTLLKVCINCHVYIAKVFETQQDMESGRPTPAMARRIANAIDYAVDQWHVDIISMSFGFDQSVKLIEEAIDRATNIPTARIRPGERQRSSSSSVTQRTQPTLIFAAASNYGARRGIAWPATHDRVICIHATDGDGNKYGSNPNPVGINSLAVLGCGVEGWYKDRVEAKTGTSVATPIAAGIAALIIDYATQRKEQYLQKMCSGPHRQWEVRA